MKMSETFDEAKIKKKVSASTNMAEIFTGGRFALFLLNFFTQMRYAYCFSRAGNRNSLSLVA